jgi:hypothetical protein
MTYGAKSSVVIVDPHRVRGERQGSEGNGAVRDTVLYCDGSINRRGCRQSAGETQAI